MSYFIKWVKADRRRRYLFTIAIDHAPDRGEVGDIENAVEKDMAALGVSPDQVGVFVVKTIGWPAVEYQSDVIDTTGSYLIFIMRASEEGAFLEDETEIGKRIIESFVKFAKVERDRVRAIVLDDCYLEVDSYEPIPLGA